MDQEMQLYDESDEGSRQSSSDDGSLQMRGSKSTAKGALQQQTSSCDKREPRFCVRRWTAMAMWAYDITVDNCAICRNHIMDKCIECQSIQETTNIDGNCSIAWGKCSHVFHMHCISKWIDTRRVCPLDNKNWEFKKVENSMAL